jgi:hypothetical protein
MHGDWHLDDVVSAIRSAAQVPGKPEVADALAAAVASQQAWERVAARNRVQEAAKTKRRQEEEKRKTWCPSYRLSCKRCGPATRE